MCRVLDRAVDVGVAAGIPIVPELFEHAVFHRAGVLTAHLVVGDPAILRGGFAVGAQVGVVVDGGVWVVVLHPAQVA